MASPSQVRLLGRFTVEAGGQPIPDADLGSRKARLLLKVLAARRGHVPMDSILDALWGDDVPAKAVENVASLVSRLRTALGSELIAGGRSGYRLVVPAGCSVDVADAERLVTEAEARLAAGQPALARTAAEQAAQLLSRGAPFEEETSAGEWLDTFRRDVHLLVRRARAAGWRAAGAVGDHRSALGLARDAVIADPLDEEAHRAMILAYHQLGEEGEALAAYERVRTVLRDELGADPGSETQALYAAVLAGEPFPDGAVPGRLPDQTGGTGETGRTGGRGGAGGIGGTGGTGGSGGIVGRDVELARLVASWEQASAGTPRCVLIMGESGIGKTRLAEALAAEARATGAVAIVARCYESEESLFLQPLVEVLRELAATLPPDVFRESASGRAGALTTLVPEIGPLLGAGPDQPTSPEGERRRTFEAISTVFAEVSKRRPLVVVLDDLHNAGASTVELVHFAMRWDRSARLLVVGTLQNDRRSGVEARRGDLAEQVRLGPLSETAVEGLAREAGRPEIVDELMRLTKGHTLFVLEALRAVTETGALVIPDSLRSAVVARVSRSGADVEEFLRAAVVEGAAFDIEHVAELLGLPGEEAVRRAETALRLGLVTEAGAGYEFANDVIRDVLYDTTPLPTRTVRHRRLAVLLADRPETAAEHAAAAGDREMAIDQWLVAATRALAAFANHEAERLMTRALDACVVVGDPVRTARVQLLRGRVLLAQSRYDAAAVDLAAAQALGRAIGDDGIESAALEDLAWCAYYGRRIERAGEFAERALAHPRAGARAQVLAGRLRSARGDQRGAFETLQSVIDSAEDPAIRATAMSYLGTVLHHDDRYGEAVRMLDDACAACRVGGLLRPMLAAVFFSVIARGNRGDLADALAAAGRLAVDVERYELDSYRARAHNAHAWLWRELGQPARSLEIAHQAREAAHLPDGYVEAEPAAHALLQVAESHLQLGDEAEAARWLAEITDATVDGVAFGWRLNLRRLEVLTRLQPDRAEELLAEATARGSIKYQALAWAALGHTDEAVSLAAKTGSDLLIAHVAADEEAAKAAGRVADRLAPDDRADFLQRGAWRMGRVAL